MPDDLLARARADLKLLVRAGAMKQSEADRRLRVWEANKDRPRPDWVKGRAYELSIFGSVLDVKAANLMGQLAPVNDERGGLMTFRAHYVGKVVMAGADMDLFHDEATGRRIYCHTIDLADWKEISDD